MASLYDDTYSLQDQPEETYSLTDPTAPLLPSDRTARDRSTRLGYALGGAGPGAAILETQLRAGQEGTMRQQLAASDDLRLVEEKQKWLQELAQQGKHLTPEQFDIISAMSGNDFRSDPKTAMEKAFADRYTADIQKVLPIYEYMSQPNAGMSDDIARDHIMFHQYATKKLQDLNDEAQSRSWPGTIKDFAAGLIPFLPWYRQAQALKERPGHWNLTQGASMEDNIMYLYKLPVPERIRQLDAALESIKKSGNINDAVQFAQAVLSFSTSDKMIGHLMSIADYTTLASIVGKPIAGLVKGAAKEVGPVAVKPALEGSEFIGPLEQQGPRLRTDSTSYTKQGDLFPDSIPEQGSFNFGADTGRTQTAPTVESKLGPGKMRGTYVTDQPTYDAQAGQYQLPASGRDIPPSGLFRDGQGKIRRSANAYKQGDLSLEGGARGETQGDLLLQGGKGEKPTTGLETPVVTPREGTPEIAKPAIRASAEELERKQRQVLAAGIKSLEGPSTPQIEHVLSSIGDPRAAAWISTLKRMEEVNPTGTADIANEVRTLLTPENWFSGSKVLGNSLAPDMAANVRKAMDNLAREFDLAARVNRLTPQAEAIAYARAKKGLEQDYGNKLGPALRTIEYNPREANPANVNSVSAIIGRTDGALFDSKEQALLFRDQHYELGEIAYPKEYGGGWALKIDRHFDEEAPDVLKALSDGFNNSKVSDLNIVGRFLRTSKDLLGRMQNENRNVATTAPQKVMAAIRQVSDANIASLTKGQRRALNDMLVINRDTNPVEGAPRGFWYKNATEYEEAFLERHGRMPKPEELRAYETAHQLHDFELLIENAAVYRDKARRAIEGARFKHADAPGGVTPWFEGKRLDGMPWEVGNKVDQDAGVYLYDHTTGKGQFFYKFDVEEKPGLSRKMVDDLIENRGFRVVQVANPKDHVLGDIAKTQVGQNVKDQINYVITNSWEHRPLSWQQVEYRAGPHSIYQHNWYVSQGIIETGRNGKATYYGDNNALNVKTRAQAEALSEKLDAARILGKNGDMDGLRAFLAKETPYSFDQFMDLFRRSDSPFNWDTPIVAKERGKNTIDTNPKLKEYYTQINPATGKPRVLVDGTKNVHDLSNLMDKGFLMDRSEVLNTVNGKTMQLAPGMQLDPLVALNQVIGQRLRNTWSNDYKIGAVSQWISQFEGLMKPESKTLQGHPLHFLFNPQYNDVSAAAQGQLAAAKGANYAIRQFIGSKSNLSKGLDAFKMRLADSVYNIAGDGKLLDMAIATTAEPTAWLRAVAFHSKLGFFNPVQLFVQANQMFHTIAVLGPTRGVPAFTASFWMRRLAHNPNAIDNVAQIATKFGWKADEFKEMYDTFTRTGLYKVGGEAAMRDDVFDPKLFRNLWGRFLDSGAMFFNEGERLGRMTGFAGAFKEWRAANPGKRIGYREIAAIENRADDLAGNMTVASKAAWQSGIWSVPTQFMSWNARMMEQLWGSRLSRADKARMLTAYSLLYGAPTGAGIAVGGVWPMYDSIKQYALGHGVNISDGYFEPFTEGLAETTLHYLTGQQFNVSQRYAPGNATQVKDMLDKTIPEVAFGASGSIIGSLIRGGAPFYYYLSSVFRDNGEFPLTDANMMGVIRQLSTADTAAKIHGIMTYGEWRSKTGTLVEDKMSGVEAAGAVFGLTPLHVADTYLLQKHNKDRAETVKYYTNRAVEALRFGFQAGGEADYKAMSEYLTQARAWIELGKLNSEEQNAAYTRATHELKTLGDKVRWDTIKKAPNGQFQQMLDAYGKKQ